MRPMRGILKGGRRVGVLVAVASVGGTLAVATSGGAGASNGAGVVYGGVTPQGWPIMVELSRDGRQVVRAHIGLDYKCTAGAESGPDFDVKLKLSNGRFSGSWGPDEEKYDDGTSSVWEGTLSLAVNRGRTKISGTWRTKFVDKDAAGAVTDTCDSGNVKWTAKQ